MNYPSYIEMLTKISRKYGKQSQEHKEFRQAYLLRPTDKKFLYKIYKNIMKNP
jgi:hypothetical protein